MFEWPAATFHCIEDLLLYFCVNLLSQINCLYNYVQKRLAKLFVEVATEIAKLNIEHDWPQDMCAEKAIQRNGTSFSAPNSIVIDEPVQQA